MVENAYESVIRRAYQDFESGDLDLLGTVMSHDVVWHEPGRSSLAGDYKGPKAVLGFLRSLKDKSGGTFNIEILEVVSQPERVHHSKITEVNVYRADTYQFDEFWRDATRSG